MTGSPEATRLQHSAVTVANASGAGRYLIVCEHASNWLPEDMGTLGLPAEDLKRHIAWDPGALAVARRLAERLDAPLVASRVSRLAIDCNRPLDAPDLIPELSETTLVPGNAGLTPGQRAARIAMAHQPFHEAVEGLLAVRQGAGLPCWTVTIHSFTPIYKGQSRPWTIGIIHDEDERLSAPLLAGLRRIEGIVVGANEPYSPADRVYYTLQRHCRPRGLPCAMVEIRNDAIGDEAGQELWAERLASILSGIEEPEINRGMEAASNAKGQRRSA